MILRKKMGVVFDRILDILSDVSSIIMASLALVIFMEVIARYFFNHTFRGIIQFSGYSLLFITFLSTAWVERKGGHVSMDILSSRLNSQARLILDLFISIVLTVASFTIFWYGAKVTLQTWRMNYLSSQELKISLYLIYFIIPFGMLLLAIQYLRKFYEYIETVQIPGTRKERRFKSVRRGKRE